MKNETRLYRIVMLITALMLAACQSVGDDVQATLAAGDVLLGTESARMATDSQQHFAEVAATVSVGETLVAERYSVNDQLFATIAAGSTPTVALIVGQAPVGQSEMVMEGNRLFTQTGTSTAVSASDGCVTNPRSSFSRGEISQIYATAQVSNTTESLNIRADWFYEGQLITQANWTMTPTTSPFCFWAVIGRADTDFPPGNYAIQLYLDDFALRDLTMSFVVNE